MGAGFVREVRMAVVVPGRVLVSSVLGKSASLSVYTSASNT